MKKYIFAALLMLSLGLNAQISNDGLIAYYPFNGDALDYSPNSHDGVLNGGIFVEDQQGNPNSALLLNGINEFVDLSEFGIPFKDNLDEISIFFKVKFVETEDNQTILSLGYPGEGYQSNVFEIEYENNRFQIESETGASSINHELQIDEPNSLFDEQWHQILIYINQDSLTYCKDGDVIFSGIYTPSETNSGNLFLGCFGGSSSEPCCFFGGLIDELQFYNRSLTKEELSVSNDEIVLNQSIKYYPNPTTSKINVELGRFYNSLFVQILDRAGKVISMTKFESLDNFEINLPDEDGIYFLQVFEQNPSEQIAFFKVIKQK